MYCKYCGERVEDGSQVCRFCGKKQEESGGVSIDMGNLFAGQNAGANSPSSTVIGAGVCKGNSFNIRKSTTRKNISTNVDNRGGLIQHSSIGSVEGRIEICPYCGKELNFPKPPRFCPYCKEQIIE